MKICLVSDSKTRINFFPELSDLLAEKIADIETESFFVPFPEDIPAKAKESIDEGAETVFVFSSIKDSSKAHMLLSKLIDVEIQTGKKIVKAIEKKGFDMKPEAKQGAAQKLAEKWAEFLIDYFYKPELFEPK
ncbi:MAG TPA: hypothetical protein VI977_04630 [archaeon]|nr:hypothetical protein [archaeon]